MFVSNFAPSKFINKLKGNGTEYHPNYCLEFGRFGDLGHDEEWGSLVSDTKGWFLGFKYVPWKNVEWETFYSRQNGICESSTRNLLRTQIDFHF